MARTQAPSARGDMLDRLVERSTLSAAFERVSENGGCREADGVTLNRFRGRLAWELDSIQDSLIRRAYHPLPLLEISIPKRGGGRRTLAVPTVRDRVCSPCGGSSDARSTGWPGRSGGTSLTGPSGCRPEERRRADPGRL